VGGLFSHFPEDRNGELLRVSMIRNPYDWLVSSYEYFKKHKVETHLNESLSEFRTLSMTSPEDFVYSYLQNIPGEISKLFLSYQADSYMRIEDMPWAMLEFLEMIGVPRPNRFPPTTVFQLAPTINDTLRRRLIKTEEEICDAFDYY